ncbi:MAG: ABC transporter ATP-binding protein [Chloroflexi bacterium]|jgi:oligopeptide/dipeptide ABC transporter ATP-binding protein|uniref:Dipeptide/oligopeptide/nickel ABC transporter ATP-binding protein n=1 Tax=Candidatus Thermofonsia Clade 3 bacterium TaxID=2364212 RepID=A0A2M8QBX4_9CHLR|nr:ABC transporter ATP-binding protein [Candidatus Roseilinea sp. NK_OTU-006]PJF47298.1 MAG: dipeptide/oligopeptide/nickel ABC transporter ATP-binding protein [Candidatus Thermofonsia Clade 3 bacterium]RMG63033.1 MAG: ABC transporter ATP-binding protein [Chloroflexota bacterium]
MTDAIQLEFKDLRVHFFTDEGVVKAVDGVDLVIPRGKTTCIVGESGCGKSVMSLTALRIVQKPGRIVSGQILWHSKSGDVIDLAKLNPKGREIRHIRGAEIAMIFQEPMTSLSPLYTIGNQIGEAIRLHQGVSKQEARARTIEMLRKVRIPRPERLVDEYPFRLSGGMRQRAMIAMALSCNPSLLIADEPTTALDVTTQAQILDLMLDLQREYNMSILFITHDLGVVAEIADSVAVMYLGRVVESSDVDTIFNNPKHPYTQALLSSVPKISVTRQPLAPIQGMVPSPFRRPSGCTFHPRCSHAMPICQAVEPSMIPLDHDHRVRCLLYDDAAHQIAPPAAALAAQ